MTGRACAPGSSGLTAAAPTPTTYGGWPPTRCGRCWPTCVGSRPGPTGSRAGTATWSASPDGSTPPTTTALTSCGPRPSVCTRLATSPSPRTPTADPVPATQSWWHAPVAEVPVGLRTHGATDGRWPGRRPRRLLRRQAGPARRARAPAAPTCRGAAGAGRPTPERCARLGSATKRAPPSLTCTPQALTRHGRPLTPESVACSEDRLEDVALRLELRAAATSVTIKSPSGVPDPARLWQSCSRRSDPARRTAADGRAAGAGMTGAPVRPAAAPDLLAEADVRSAARSLLHTPLLHAAAHPDELGLVRRHRDELTRLFGDGLGYRLAVEPGLARLLQDWPGAGRQPRTAAPQRRPVHAAPLRAARPHAGRAHPGAPSGHGRRAGRRGPSRLLSTPASMSTSTASTSAARCTRRSSRSST